MHPKKKEKSQDEHETDDAYQVPMHFAHAPYLCAPTSPSMVSGKGCFGCVAVCGYVSKGLYGCVSNCCHNIKAGISYGPS